MKFEVNIEGSGRQDYDDTPEHAGYPRVDDILGAPATLEISFYDLFTEPDGSDWKDLVDAETAAQEIITRTVSLTQGIYVYRPQTDYFNYHRNSYSFDPQFYIDNFGPANSDRFKRKPLSPILIDDPDTIPPNVLDRDTGMRWDGVGVNSPMLHVDLIKDKKKPVSVFLYKKNILERECNLDLVKGVEDFIDNGFSLPRKWSSIKRKKTDPLTYVIDHIWINKAHLSIEEIESASHCVTGMVATTGATADPPYSPDTAGYAIDSIEGIFWNKFDTYLAKERTAKDGSTVKARYKITRTPEYSGDAYTQPLLNFVAGGTVKAEVYLVPRSAWFYGRFYSPGVIEELNNSLETLILHYQAPGDPPVNSYTYVKGLCRNAIENYTNIFCLWSRFPHDYLLPARNDNVINNENYDKTLVSMMGGLTSFTSPVEGYSEPQYYGISSSNGNFNNLQPAQQWSCFVRSLHDPRYNDEIAFPPDLFISRGSRGNVNHGFSSSVFYPSSYGYLIGGMRGLFLYNFSPIIWSSVSAEAYYFGLTIACAESPIGHDLMHPLVHGSFSLWHKTPSGCVFHSHTRPWINTHVAERYPIYPGYIYAGKRRNVNYQELLGYTLSPPDGGVMRFDENVIQIACGYQYPDTGKLSVEHENTEEPSYLLWPECLRQPHNGNGLYNDDEITNFQKLWNKFYNSALVEAHKSDLNDGAYPSDNVPFIVGVAGAKAETLVAMLRIDKKVFYIWRALDEEEDTGEDDFEDIPLLPISAHTSFQETLLGATQSYWYALMGCGEIWNAHTETGNIKVLSDILSEGVFELGIPGIQRIAMEIVHQNIEWPEEMPSLVSVCGVEDNFVDSWTYPDYEVGDVGQGISNPYPGAFAIFNPSIVQEKLFDLEMPVYIAIYREQALLDTGPTATRWGGSFNQIKDYYGPDYEIFTVSAANRNKDSCG